MIERYSFPEMAHIWTPEHRADCWLALEIAVSEAWADRGRVPREALERIRGASYNLERMAVIEKETNHEPIAFLRTLEESVGDVARFIHLGLTSSDMMDTGLAMQVRDAADLLLHDLDGLEDAITRQALRHKDTLMIGRTHGVHAEPITFGFKLAAWIDELRRHRTRLVQARTEVAVGKISGAVGTHANVPASLEDEVCARLGLGVEPVSTQIVHRDRHAHFLSVAALLAASLEKMCIEIRGLQRTEVREVEEPFEPGQQGSSAMPHKRNPILCERLTGLARVVRGYATTGLENVALWHERDISHSSTERIILPDACILLDYMLRTFTYVVEHLQVYPENMLRNLALTHGLIFSQRVLLALVEKGMARGQAYKVVQEMTARVWQTGEEFLALLRDDPAVRVHLAEGELEALFDYRYHLQEVDVPFRRLGLLAADGEDTR